MAENAENAENKQESAVGSFAESESEAQPDSSMHPGDPATTERLTPPGANAPVAKAAGTSAPGARAAEGPAEDSLPTVPDLSDSTEHGDQVDRPGTMRRPPREAGGAGPDNDLTATGTPAARPVAPAAPPFPAPRTYDDPRLGSEPRGLPASDLAVPDTVLDGAGLPGLTVRGASLRGDDHRFYNETRQDSMGIWELRGEDDGRAVALLACVADGVGSQPNSQFGSAAICRLLREEMQADQSRLLDPEFDPHLQAYCQVLAGRLSQRLSELALREGLEPKTVSTTLVATLADAQPADPAHRRCVMFAVGDSPAFVLRNGAFEPCFARSPDELIASTATDALPTRYASAKSAVARIGPDDMILLCTDGLSNPMHNRAVAEQLAAWWSRGEIPGLPEFGWQLSFRAKSYGDDRTAVCVWGRGQRR